jgi:hypoxanthine phosphoribosyltransferase
MRKGLTPLLSADNLRAVVAGLAEDIREDYRGKVPVLVGLLKGAFVFIADLARAMEIDVEVEFIQPSSYKEGSSASREVELVHSLKGDVNDRDVIIVDGIVDSGATLRKVVKEVLALGPASVKVCSLLVRKDVKRVVTIDYRGLEIPAGFVVGYGMDLGGRYRHLKGIYTVIREAGD